MEVFIMAEEFVKSNVVSMNWVKKGFMKLKGVFYFASQEYTNKDGATVTVFFSPYDAFFWADRGAATIEDLWTINDLVPWAKDNADGSFPQAYDEFVKVVDDDGKVIPEMLEKFGIEEYAADIEARLKDIAKFTELRDAN